MTVTAGTPSYPESEDSIKTSLPPSYLVDTCFLPGYLWDGLAQNSDMVDAERGNARRYWFGYDIRTVEPAADANFEDGSIHL